MLQLTALNDSEVETIHQGTLRILAETGVIMKHPGGLEILTGEGAQLRGDRLLMPPDLVERMLKRCPAQVTVRGRGGGSKVLGDGSLHWHNLGGARDIMTTARGRAGQPRYRTCAIAPACSTLWRASRPSRPSSRRAMCPAS